MKIGIGDYMNLWKWSQMKEKKQFKLIKRKKL